MSRYYKIKVTEKELQLIGMALHHLWRRTPIKKSAKSGKIEALQTKLAEQVSEQVTTV